MAKKKQLGAPAAEEQAVDAVQKYLTYLKDYQNVVFAVVVLVLTIGILGALAHQRGEAAEDAAWTELGKARDRDVDKAKASMDKYEGSGAHPFLAIDYAAKLYERGNKDDLLAAKTVLERTRDEVRGNEILSDLVRDQLVGVQKELEDTKLFADTAHQGS